MNFAEYFFIMQQGCNPICTACPHKHLSMEESLFQKYKYLRSKLTDWSGIIDSVRSVSSEKRWGYRDKVSLAMQYIDGRWVAGLLKRDILLPIEKCPVHTKRVNHVLSLILNALPDFSEFPVVRYVQSGKQLTLVIKSKNLPSVNWITDGFKKSYSDAGMEGLWFHLFPSTGKKVFGKGGWHLVLGSAVSMDESGFFYGPAAFQQLLPELAQDALNEAGSFLQPDNDSIVADLYSGTGSSLRRWHSSGAIVIGVEQLPESVSLARMNAPEVQVLLGSCTQRIPQLDQWVSEFPDKKRLLYLNPSRTGIEREVIDWIINSYQPERIAYLSCNVLTLRNDLLELSSKGYQVKRIIPFDFFPQTRHIETLVLIAASDH